MLSDIKACKDIQMVDGTLSYRSTFLKHKLDETHDSDQTKNKFFHWYNDAVSIKRFSCLVLMSLNCSVPFPVVFHGKFGEDLSRFSSKITCPCIVRHLHNRVIKNWGFHI